MTQGDMERRTLCSLIISLALVALPPVREGETAMAEEGLFNPEQIVVPFDKERVLKSLVRIRPHIYFAATVFERKEDAETFRPTKEKTFLPEGVVLWHLVLTKADLHQIHTNMGLRLRPALFEVARAFEGVSTFPSQKIVPLEGAAVGFFISPKGLFLTNYHVMREEIEAANRTGGSSEEMLCRSTAFEVPIVKKDQIVGWRPLEGVKLIRNLSAQEWKKGYDAALLKVDIRPPAYLPLAHRQPRLGEEVWMFGFPVRTQRSPERLKAVGYEDADGSLRVSHGKVTKIPTDHNFISNADSFSGNSGSPTLARDGEVLGYAWDSHPEEEENRRAVIFQGGTIHVTIQSVAKKLQIVQEKKGQRGDHWLQFPQELQSDHGLPEGPPAAGVSSLW